MTGTDDTPRPRASERIAAALGQRPAGPLLLLYGTGLWDSFVGSDHVERDIAESLWLELKARGFERVLFHSSRRWIHFLDEASIPRSQAPAAPSGGGPLGGASVLQFQNPAPIRSDAVAVDHIERYLSEEGARSAVVLHDAETFLNYLNIETQRMLAGLLHAWHTAPSGCQHLCLMLFSALDPERLGAWLGRQHALAALLAASETPAVLPVGGPGRTEVERIVDLVRLRDGLEVDWAERRQLVRQLTVEARTAKSCLALLRGAARARRPFSLDTARRGGWFRALPEDLRDPWERLDALVGADAVKAHLCELRYQADLRRREEEAGLPPRPRPSLNMAFAGNPGTGKTTVARIVGEILAELGFLARGHTVEVTASDLVGGYVGETFGKTEAKVNEALDGVLFVDEAYQLDPGERGSDGANAYGMQALETLMRRMEGDRHRLCVILAGYTRKMRQLLKVNPGLERRVTVIAFDDYDPPTLLAIVERMVAAERLTMTTDLREALRQVLERMYELRDDSFGNAGEARKLAEALSKRRAARIARASLPDDAPLEEADIPDSYRAFLPQRSGAASEAWTELDGLVGLEKLKARLRELEALAFIREQEAAAGRPLSELPSLHMIFEGNPGTGKTTAARLMGRILADLRLLPRPDVHGVGAGDLIGAHVGETFGKTERTINQALGGVLFVDEAYQLDPGERGIDGANAYGMQAIETLMARMENDRHRLCVILAGYPNSMDRLLSVNPGLSRRIPLENRIRFDDPSADDLIEVARRLITKDGLAVPPDLARLIAQAIESMHATRGENFGGAGEVRNFVAALMTGRRKRVAQKGLALDAPLEASDFPDAYRNHLPPEIETLDTLLAELDGLIGLAPVKRFVRDQVNLLRLEMQGSPGRSVREPELRHMVFTGSPGTGKTMVARLMGRIFRNLGVVKRGHVIPVSERDLTAGAWNEVGKATRRKVNEALGGVLFIDEAYALADNPAGPQAVGELLTAMVDHRDRLVVIAAGYERDMERFFAINPGLRGRFPHKVAFPDYDARELATIATAHAARQGFTLEPSAAAALELYFDAVLARKPRDFENARFAEGVVTEMKKRLAARLFEERDPSAAPRLFAAADVPTLSGPCGAGRPHAEARPA